MGVDDKWLTVFATNGKQQRVTGEDGNKVSTPQMAKLFVQFLSPFQGENRVSEWKLFEKVEDGFYYFLFAEDLVRLHGVVEFADVSVRIYLFW